MLQLDAEILAVGMANVPRSICPHLKTDQLALEFDLVHNKIPNGRSIMTG